jgi:hypothetical protein
MQKPYAADISKARTYLGTCAEDPASGSECNEMVAALTRYEAQQYCLSSYEHSVRSDGLIDKDKAQSASESAAAIRDAGRCKNTYAYAYRGIALVEHNAATYLQGNHDISEFREGHALLTRCISELRGSTESADLFTACKSSLAAANSWLAKVGP